MLKFSTHNSAMHHTNEFDLTHAQKTDLPQCNTRSTKFDLDVTHKQQQCLAHWASEQHKLEVLRKWKLDLW